MTEILATADIDPDIIDRIGVWSDYRVKDAVKAVPGAKWDSAHRRWHIPMTWPACLALRGQLGASLKIMPGLNEWALEQRDMKQILLNLHRDVLGTGLGPTVSLLGFDALFPFQRVAAEAISIAGQYALFDETGTGKSRSSLAGLSLIAEALGKDAIFPALIVAPKSMLRTWQREEIPRFFPLARVSIIDGTPTQVKKALEPGMDVYVCSYDTVRRYARHAAFPTVTLKPEDKVEKELDFLGLKTIIADEVHRIKNPGSQQTRAMWHLGETAIWKIGLSGSPMQETPEDLWAILRFLCREEYPTKSSYVDRYLLVDYNDWGGREVVGLDPRTSDEFLKNLEARFRRVTKAMVLDWLPPKVFSVRWVELPPKMRRAYNDMKKHMVAELEDGSSLASKSVLEKALRLTQLANSSGSLEEQPDGTEVFRMAAPSPKVDAFMEDINNGDYDGQQVVVFSDSRQLLEICAEAMTKKKHSHVMITGDVTGDDRQKAIDTFQAGDAKFCLITRAGGEGITLTAASTMVRLVRSWSFIVHRQSEDRVHRIGSEIHDRINYVDYITEETVEEGQIGRLHAKGAAAEEVFRDADLLAIIKGK